mgnify:CR=1 FL=1
MIGQRVEIWRQEEYFYADAYDFIPIMVTYIHEDEQTRPAMLVVPGGAYRYASPSEGDVVARWFYKAGYNVFVLAYTVNYLEEPLGRLPLNDISRAVRIIRKRAEACRIDPNRVVLCGFSAGGHLSASLCVHYKDIRDCRPEYDEISNRPDAAILGYPVITAKDYEESESFQALLGKEQQEADLEYMSLEKHVTEDTPPCFIWQTAPDGTVPVLHSYLFAEACRNAGIKYAHLVFSDGVHGMSIANEDWLEGRNRDPYTLEQLVKLAEAIKAGKTKYPEETGEAILEEQGITKPRPEKRTPEEKEHLRRILDEVGMWPEMAVTWLERILEEEE